MGGVIGGIIEALLIVFLLAAAAFIFMPSDNCERVDNASSVFYGTVGLVPFIAEKTLKQDAKKEWRSADKFTRYFYSLLTDYFDLNHVCSAPSMRPWGVREFDQNALDWLKKNDFELYQKASF